MCRTAIKIADVLSYSIVTSSIEIFDTFEDAIKYLKEQEFEYDGTEPCGTIVRYKQSRKKKVAHVHAPDASTVQAYYHSAPSNPSPAAAETPAAPESLDGLREAARAAIAALTEQAARLEPAIVDSLKAVLRESSTAGHALEACKTMAATDCMAAVKNFNQLTEKMLAKHESIQQEANGINKALTHMKAALELLNA